MGSDFNGKSLNQLRMDELILFIAERGMQNSKLLETMSNEISSLRTEIENLKDISVIPNEFNRM